MKFFVVGNPISHSLSPTIHNFWLKQNNLNHAYEKKKLIKEQLKHFINEMRREEFGGANITVPFKESLFKHVDKFDDVAAGSGAINTIYKKDCSVIGTNTDGQGFLMSLKKDCNFEIRNKKVFVIGAGGASRGIIYSLIRAQCSNITVVNRNLKKTEKLLNDFTHSKQNILDSQIWEQRKIHNDIDLVINATSIGMKKKDTLDIRLKNLKKSALIYDIVYASHKTDILLSAEKFGLRTQNGLSMLIRQAAESFFKWFKIYPSEKQILQVSNILKEKK